MTRNRLFVTCACALVLVLSLGACGSDSKKESSDSKSEERKSVSSSSGKSDFVKDVAKVCQGIDREVFDELSNSDIAGDPDAFQEALKNGEDELDNVISDLEDIDPPSKFSDDWDTFLDDFSAMRDAYPQLGEGMASLTRLATDSQSTDPATAQAAQTQMIEVQADLQELVEDLSQRGEEIAAIADRLGLEDCNLD
ncbi:MAG TPA: hypothetical protein PKB15_00315 [Acidimicrobiia bacterium]|nr:hypothetical protein [Acidimicrobiia bacterium]